jgi:23S rRNA (uridine2552-2'-O)-methyltransferase
MYEKPDHYSIKAQKQGYAARSVYKLIEIDQKFRLFKNRQKILDLGSAPGSWSQYVSKIVGKDGLVVGIDLKEMKFKSPNFVFISGDFLKKESQERLKEFCPFDGIISDMAPDTSGDKLSDCSVSSDLVDSALRFSYDFLKKGGFFIAKIFQGGNERQIMQEIKKGFGSAKFFKPESCRKNSVEIYIVAQNFIKKPDITTNDGNIINNDNYDGTMPW